jgi:tRNA uridine 5-carboxymethylaminomethyl modification enzyme
VAAERERIAAAVVPFSDEVNRRLSEAGSSAIAQSVRAIELLKRPEISYRAVLDLAGLEPALTVDQAAELEIEVKYDGYVKRQADAVERFKRLEETVIPAWLDYAAVPGLSTEVRERLVKVQPRSLGQAARMPGVTPAAISLLAVHIRGNRDRVARAG